MVGLLGDFLHHPTDRNVSPAAVGCKLLVVIIVPQGLHTEKETVVMVTMWVSVG